MGIENNDKMVLLESKISNLNIHIEVLSNDISN
jgi:outer membrane murein-binding lipoprotein Lpp